MARYGPPVATVASGRPKVGKLQSMNARFKHYAVREIPQVEFPQVETACVACKAYEPNLCQAALTAEGFLAQTRPTALSHSVHSVPARRIICREQDLHDAVPIICDGWAASIVMLTDGSRQILSFLLPGDLVSTVLLFEPRPQCLVEAITDVRYRTFKRSALRGILFREPSLFDKFAKAWIEERGRSDQLIVDLGRRGADERIARLILNLAERLARRDMIDPSMTEMEFPLRQHHIADATGLTPVHVSKVLSEFRREGLIKISDRSLSILDPERFRRVAYMR